MGLIMMAAAVTVESFAQMFLKLGAGGGPRAWVGLGVIFYLLQIAAYTAALSRLDVSVAFPLGSLCFVGVTLLSKLFLGEAVGAVRWLGVCCILGGAVLMAL